MIFEQTLINPNFIGRDGFRWFLAMTAKDSDAYNNFGTRVKIRILGYHGDDVDDKDLPWAHILVPLTMGSGVGGQMCQGTTCASQLVIGFFADGDDGQQPIVIGSFYTGGQTEFDGKFADGTRKLKLFTGPISSPFNKQVITEQRTGIQTATGSRSSVAPNSTTPGVPNPGAKVAAGGETLPSVGGQSTNNTSVVNRPGHCKNAGTGFGKILNALRDFIGVLNTVKQVANKFINPILNTITNLDEEIAKIGTLISDWIISQFKIVRDKIINAVYSQLKRWLDQIRLPPWVEKIKKALVGELTDGIWCAVGKILKKIKDYVINFLFGLIGNVVSIPFCAAGAFIGSAIQTITNEITEALGPILDQVTSIIGPIGTVISYVDQAIGYVKGALTFLDCDSPDCSDQYDYKMNVGFIPKGSIDDFQKAINYSPASGVQNLLDDASGNVQKWLGDFGGGGTGISPELSGASALFSDCNIFSFECGPPTVSIFGGGGSGASGNAVVDAAGGILGVNITNPGSGYSEPPYITFEDPCNNGSGAYGVAKIGVVTTSSGIGSTTMGVTDVTMYYPGSGYLGPSTSTDPCKVTPFDETGAPVTGTISRVIIENTGIGYASSDRIYDAACPNDVEMYPIVDNDGRIYDINIVNPGTSINIRPRLEINSENGYGAVLIPSLVFNPISGVTTETSREKVTTVVYCAEDHV